MQSHSKKRNTNVNIKKTITDQTRNLSLKLFVENVYSISPLPCLVPPYSTVKGEHIFPIPPLKREKKEILVNMPFFTSSVGYLILLKDLGESPEKETGKREKENVYTIHSNT